MTSRAFRLGRRLSGSVFAVVTSPMALAAATLAVAAVAGAQPRFDVPHSFAGGSEGSRPLAAVVQATDGNLYGVTSTGGTSDLGTVYKMTHGGSVTTLHAFTGGTDGFFPGGPLIQANDGDFYGTTGGGGVFSYGTIFKINPSGALTIVHAFTGADGDSPLAALLQATDGNFYGTAPTGGAGGQGVVFKMTPGGTFTVLHAFSGPDGSTPSGALIQATDGNLYGTARNGGAYGGLFGGGGGTSFKITLGGTFTLLHEFAGGADGARPNGVIQAADGNFYGTTSAGGTPDHGTVFRMTSGGAVTVLHAFTYGTDGGFPLCSLLQGPDGNFYGTTVALGGGSTNQGTVFRITPEGTLTVLHGFGGADGADPTQGLVRASDGNLYGTTRLGGLLGDGVVFRLKVGWVAGDFDGDSKSDLTVFRASTGGWHTLNSSTDYGTSASHSWGLSTDTPVPGDYDGDGKIDPAVYRPSTGGWHVLKSSTSYATSFSVSLGFGTAVPVPADYDGDGRTDVAVFVPSEGAWFVLKSSTNFGASTGFSWGLPTDLPVPGDYDGDGKADPAIYRPSTGLWAILKSSTNYTTSTTVSWGLSTDIPVPGDYDGDGKIDPAVYRPSTGGWYALKSSTHYASYIGVSWGLSTDTPVPADYDGDGKIDPTIFRPSIGVWAILNSSTGFTTARLVSWGLSTDVPINKRP